MGDKLGKAILKKGVLYAVVASPTGEVWVEYGDKGELAYDGIVKYYFPGPDFMPRLDRFLEGQILPKVIRQGELMCVICKPSRERIIGLFLHDNGDALVGLQRARDLNARIESIFGTTATQP